MPPLTPPRGRITTKLTYRVSTPSPSGRDGERALLINFDFLFALHGTVDIGGKGGQFILARVDEDRCEELYALFDALGDELDFDEAYNLGNGEYTSGDSGEDF